MPLPELAFHPVDRRCWSDLERLFEAPGGPRHCWCMVWREMPAAARRSGAPAKKAALAERVRDGAPIGLIAYRADQPIAWCSVAPRHTYRRLDGDATAHADDWVIACLYAKRAWRGQGIAAALIAAAVEFARSQRAPAIEAYPVAPDAPSYRFMGFVPTFARAGFREIERVGTRRHRMRLELL